MKRQKRCKNSKCIFNPCIKVKKQNYCNKKLCQKARKREWQKNKIDNNPDYKKDQNEAKKLWNENNSDYWKQYRAQNLEYTNRNRLKQKTRNSLNRSKKNVEPIAKMDSIFKQNSILSGKYRIVPLSEDIAKMDTINGKIYSITDC